MAQIQFLNGLRDGDVQDLVEEASLSLGQAEGQLIQVKDQGVEAEHALLYSVKGQFYVMVQPTSPAAKVFLNFKPIGPTATAVADKEISMFGRTLAKFWLKQAPSGGGGGAGVTMAAPAADPRVARERDEARTRVAELEKQLAAASTGASGTQASLDAARREKDDVAKQLEARKKELESAGKDKDSLGKEVAALKKDKKDLETRAEGLDRDLEKTKSERDDSNKRADAVSSDLDAEKKRASELETELAATKPALAQKDGELEALRKATRELESADARAKRDCRAALREGSDLAKALEALAVPDALRDRIAAAARDEVDREVLSRQGPVVPLRGLRCPGCDADLDAELGQLKARRRQTDALRTIGLGEITPDDLKALVERARTQAAEAVTG